MSLYPNSYPDCGEKHSSRSSGKRKSCKKYTKKSEYGYMISMLPKESQKYADDIKYSATKLFKSLKKNIMKNY